MSHVTIYHNPRCSKSRQALGLLEERGIVPKVIRYLENPPSPDELRELLAELGVGAQALVRRSEPLYAELGLGSVDDDALLAAMHAHPLLIERPIVRVSDARGSRAVVGRPPERVLELLPAC
jgi:arsenate reductase (glutaredoxin)